MITGLSRQGGRLPDQAAAPAQKRVAMEDREAICAACQFNVDWICEHVGCRTCSGRQRNTGGLRTLLAQPGARCPAGKW
jgi:hypothetical protein